MISPRRPIEHRLVLTSLLLLGGCSDTGTPAAQGASGAAGSSSSGGFMSGGSSGNSAGSLAHAPGGAGGAAAGTGGTLPSGAGMAGSLAGGASAGGGAGSAGLLAIAAELDKVRLECPCIDADHFGLDKPDTCDASPEVDRQIHTKTLGGDPAVIYDVKLHVRGNTEPNIYVNGKLEQERFYTGGETSTPPYTSYMLTVAEPHEVYYFNHNPNTGHIHFLFDYEVVIPMKGGTSVTFEVNGGKSVPDGHGVSNRESLVVPGIPPAPAPFNGQLVQFDVVSVEVK